MIHTMTITHRIESIRVYNEIFEQLKLISKFKGESLYPQGNEYITHALKEIGIRRMALSKKKVHSKYKYPFMQMSITLNPAILIGKGYEEIMCECDIENVENEFNKFIQAIHRDLPRFPNWVVNRIDYAINIRTDNVKEYVRLFQRADKPLNYQELYCKNSKRRKQLEGSFYLISNGVNINFYDKEDQMLKVNFNDDGINNLLRLEVQCKKAKINSIKQSKGFDTCLVKYFLDLALSKEVIFYYYKKIIGKGDYYTLEEAIRIIRGSSYRNRVKSKCISILKSVSVHKSIWKARDNSIYLKEDFNRYSKYVQALDINLVTIPKKWGVDKMKCLM